MRASPKAVMAFAAAFSVSMASAASASNAQAPVGDELTATITALDGRIFSAYNHCDLAGFARYIAPDIEFYHDKGGLTKGCDKLVDSIKNNICGKLRRELMPGTLEVYPMKGFGAVEIGSHRFCDLGTGNCDAVARFIHLWQYRDGDWSITRVISYDHQAGVK